MEDSSTRSPDTPPAAARGPVMVPAAILLLYSVLVSRLPLLNYLGYEYSVALAIVFPLVPGLYFLRAFNRGPGAVKRVSGLAFLCLLLPLGVGYLNALSVKNCSPKEGLEWYLLLSAPSMIWVVGLAYCCAAAFKRRVTWYLLIIAGVLLHPLLLGYFTPRVDSYNFIYGYFPGLTYDEDLRIDSVVLLWRAVTLVCALGLFTAGGVMRVRRRLTKDPAGDAPVPPGAMERPAGVMKAGITLLLVITLTLSAAWYCRTELGFETTASSLQQSLGSLAETRHFRIWYDSSAIPADEIRWVAAEHEFRYSQVSRFLGTDTNRVIESYIYPGVDTKRRLIGAGNTDIAKPWRGEIHLDGESWRITLKHELVHALAAEFGMPVIRANVNIGLTEGLAMAASPWFGNRTLREYAASMLRFGVVQDPAALIRPAGFAVQSSTVSYVLMGAFCEHLIARYGLGPLKTWYGGGSPEDAYGMDADSLIAEWRRSLDSVRVPEEWRAHTDYYFRRGSIFARECARAIANLNADGGRSLGRRDFTGAKNIFAEALEQSWNAASFAGLTRALLGGREYARVIDLFETERADTAKQGSLAGVKLLYGDALLVVSDYDGARKVYDEIRALDLSPGINEAVALRMVIVNDPALTEYLSPVIAGTMDDSTALEWLSGITVVDNPAVLAFLKGRLLAAKGDYAATVRETSGYGAPFLSRELNSAINGVAASALFRLGEFRRAREFFERTLEYSPGATITQRVRDRQERCAWYEREWKGMVVKLSPFK